LQPDAPAPEPSEPVVTGGAALRDEADRLIADGKVLKGLEVFRRAVAAEPTAKNHGDLGSLLYRLTAFDEAATHLRAAAELDPSNADRWIALANAYYRKVDPGEAWKAERRAREAEPGLELARDGSGMRIRKGDKAPREP
jgi:tetratricopeptide (TPR) repeat protein